MNGHCWCQIIFSIQLFSLHVWFDSIMPVLMHLEWLFIISCKATQVTMVFFVLYMAQHMLIQVALLGKSLSTYQTSVIWISKNIYCVYVIILWGFTQQLKLQYYVNNSKIQSILFMMVIISLNMIFLLLHLARGKAGLATKVSNWVKASV